MPLAGRGNSLTMNIGHLQRVKVGTIIVSELALAEVVLPWEEYPLGIVWWKQEVG